MDAAIMDRWIADPASVSDAEGAEVLRSRERARPERATWSPEGRRRLGGEIEIGCRSARRSLRPLPGVTVDENDPDIAEVRRPTAEHTEQCGDCRGWVAAGMLLFLGAEGVAAYEELYTARRAVPACLAIIQPGGPPQGPSALPIENWTYFPAPDGALARVVEQNPAGVPQFLLCGGSGQRNVQLITQSAPVACWPAYRSSVASYLPRSRDLGAGR